MSDLSASARAELEVGMASTSGSTEVADKIDATVAKNGISGTFVTADVPAKTITVVDGQIVSIV